MTGGGQVDFKQVLSRYREDFEKLNIRIYSRQHEEDILILRWWIRLQQTGEISDIRNPEAFRLSTFFSDFQPPTTLLYALDRNGQIDFACWLDAPPADRKTVYHGNWTAAEIRGTRRQYNLTRLSYQLIFEFFENITALTWQPELLKIHEKLGYVITGTIPNYLGHELVYQVYLTKPAFYSSRFMRVGGR